MNTITHIDVYIRYRRMAPVYLLINQTQKYFQ